MATPVLNREAVGDHSTGARFFDLKYLMEKCFTQQTFIDNGYINIATAQRTLFAVKSTLSSALSFREWRIELGSEGASFLMQHAKCTQLQFSVVMINLTFK